MVSSNNDISLFQMLSKLFIPTSTDSLLQAQRALLRSTVKHSHVEHKEVFISTGRMNYIEVTRHGRTQDPQSYKSTLVLCHGLGCGLGFFFPNYDALSLLFDRIIAIDWMGMGGSDRIRYPKRLATTSMLNSMASPLLPFSWGRKEPNLQQPTDFFLDSLDELLRLERADSFTLAGHSLGGYLTARYTIKYPHKVKALALISPVGLPTPPPASSQEEKLPFSLAMIQFLWAANLTPQGIIRATGPRGRGLVRSMVERRFRRERQDGVITWSADEVDLITDYMYHVTAAPASGELAMNTLLQPVFSVKQHQGQSRITGGVYAREPLLQDLATALGNKSNTNRKIPLLVMFGDRDWLRYDGAEEDMQHLRNSHGINASLDIIGNAGHHLYLENPKGFEEAMKRWLESF